jgi:hypothetical protein
LRLRRAGSSQVARRASTSSRRFAGVILENGVVRTMDPQLPTARALAIAAGGAVVHKTALASPEVVDLRGCCVLPGFTRGHRASDSRPPVRRRERAGQLVTQAHRPAAKRHRPGDRGVHAPRVPRRRGGSAWADDFSAPP